MVWTQEQYEMCAEDLAPRLIGKLLCRTVNGQTARYRIRETECYMGESDTACHAHKGRTARTDVMYGAGGRAYVYLCYGMHHLLNLTAGADGSPEAVLIRAVEGAVGPGRVTKLLSVDRTQNRMLLTPQNGLWVEDDGVSLPWQALPRVGIGYASAEDQARLWRFVAQMPIA